jgi:hypothetical protein
MLFWLGLLALGRAVLCEILPMLGYRLSADKHERYCTILQAKVKRKITEGQRFKGT